MTDPIGRTAGKPGQLVYSVEEAASMLGIGRTFMFRLIATGAIESFKIGKRRKIPGDAIRAYVQRLLSEQAARVDSGDARHQNGQTGRTR